MSLLTEAEQRQETIEKLCQRNGGEDQPDLAVPRVYTRRHRNLHNGPVHEKLKQCKTDLAVENRRISWTPADRHLVAVRHESQRLIDASEVVYKHS